ncbi:MAG TPA: SRPBCC family protein [Candidatus Limnocylindrales bacterium]|jgi:hypothetical protein
MRSALSIEVAAPPELVFRLARDPLRWPMLLPHYVRAQLLDGTGPGALVAFVARRPLLPVLGLGIPVAWRSRTWDEPEQLRLRFLHQGGATAGMDVTWRIEPDRGGLGTEVTIVHDFRPRVRAWAVIVDRLFTRPIAGRTLATFKALAEAVAQAGTSALPGAANQPS